MGLIKEESFVSRSMKIRWAARNGAIRMNTLNFDAIPSPIREPEIIEAFLFPEVATLYKKNNVHTEKNVTNVSKVKKWASCICITANAVNTDANRPTDGEKNLLPSKATPQTVPISAKADKILPTVLGFDAFSNAIGSITD